MVDVKIKGLGQVKENIKREFNKIKSDPALLMEIGEATTFDIVANARSGRNPETKEKFPTLSKGWVEKRSSLKKYNSTDEFFLNSFKSNLTFTGQLLRSIKYKIIKSKSTVEIYADGIHKGYKTSKSLREKSVSNKQIVKDLEERGWVFMTVSEQLKKRINVLTKRFIRNLIKTGRL